MDQPTSGDIVLENKCISTLPPDKRPTCMVFQFLALFPHMTVGQNIEFPMRVKGIAPENVLRKLKSCWIWFIYLRTTTTRTL